MGQRGQRGSWLQCLNTLYLTNPTDPSGTAGPQLQPRTMTNSVGDPDLRSYVRNDENVPPPKIAPPVFLSVAPQVKDYF